MSAAGKLALIFATGCGYSFVRMLDTNHPVYAGVFFCLMVVMAFGAIAETR